MKLLRTSKGAPIKLWLNAQTAVKLMKQSSGDLRLFMVCEGCQN